MALFVSLLYKVLPLYINIALGFFAGKRLHIDREQIARLIFYIIAPVIIFTGVMNTKLNLNILMLPLIIFGISCVLCSLIFFISKFIWKDSLANLAAYSAGAANTGYFGLPVALMLFNDQGEGVYLMGLLGINLFENSVGYYVLARGTCPPRECALKLTRLPTLYAFISALILNYMGFSLPETVIDLAQYFKGAFTVLGMMIIGLGIAALEKFTLNFKFIAVTFLTRFVLWPAAVFFVIWIDHAVFGVFDESICKAMILIASVPLAANTVVLASLFKIHPGAAATTVLLSTLAALGIIPLVAALFPILCQF